MADKQFRGIFAIPPTPFNPDETLDSKGLDSILNFTVDAGAHGISDAGHGERVPGAR